MTVDDSISVRKMVSFTLQQAGYTVLEAEDGNDALNKLKSTNIDLLITDLNMPNCDGISLIKQLRAQTGYRFLPIIFLTTESADDKKAQAKASGATGWITKPFKQEQLLAVIKKVLP